MIGSIGVLVSGSDRLANGAGSAILNSGGNLVLNRGIQVGGWSGTASAGAIRWTGASFQGFNGSTWVSFDALGNWSRDSSGFLHPTTNTDSVHIGHPSPASAVRLVINTTSGFEKIIDFRTGATNRWRITVFGSESGGNTGSDFRIISMTDAGAFLRDLLWVTRSSGATAFFGSPSNTTQIRFSGGFTASGSTIYKYHFEGDLTGSSGSTQIFTAQVTSQIVTQSTSDTISQIAGLNLPAPTITNNLTGGGSIQRASTLQILGAPNEGTDRFSIYVDSGLTRLHDLRHAGSNLGFFNASPVSKRTVTGSRGGNTALASLLTALSDYGLITDSTT